MNVRIESGNRYGRGILNMEMIIKRKMVSVKSQMSVSLKNKGVHRQDEHP